MDEPKVITDQQTVTITMPQEVIEPKTEKLNDLIEAENKANPIQDASTIVPVPPVLPPVEVVKEVVKPEEDKPLPNAQRPCSFCQRKVEVEKKTKEYIDKCRGKTGEKPTIPFIEEIADILDVDSDTIVNWATKRKEDGELEHEAFFGTYKSLKNHQKLQLLKRTLGRYNPTGAIFQLKVNHGCIETEKHLLAGDKNEPVVIEIIEERKIPDAS